jgi:hypothetical protein
MDIQHMAKDMPFEEHSSYYYVIVAVALLFLLSRLYYQ